MKMADKVATAAGVAALLWVWWYDNVAVQCRRCQAEAGRRRQERHDARYHKEDA